jgi:hypothetical protein
MLYHKLNGLRIKISNTNDGEVYFVDEGKARHIPDVETYNAMFNNWDFIWTISFSQHNMIDIGRPIPKGGYPIFHWGPDFYFDDWSSDLSSGSRHIANPQTMLYCNFKSDTPSPSQDPREDSRGLGSPIAWVPVDGNRVMAGNAMYLMDRGQKRHIKDPATYISLFGDTEARVADSLDDIPSGPDIATPSTRLVRVSDMPDQQTYLLDNGFKRLIKGANTMSYYSFNGGTVTGMSWAYLLEVPDGSPIAWPIDNSM